MWRPSDIAPNGVYFNSELQIAKPLRFELQHVCFHDEGTMSLTFMGIKMTWHIYTGYTVLIHPHKNVKLCPVQILHMYIYAEDYASQTVTGSCIVSVYDIKCLPEFLKEYNCSENGRTRHCTRRAWGSGVLQQIVQDHWRYLWDDIDAKIDSEIVMEMGLYSMRTMYS